MFDMAGDDVISFGLGEPDFQPPEVAIDAMTRAMKEGRNKYTTTAGLPELRRKIAESWEPYQSGMDENNVCMTMSGTNALLNCFMALVNSDDNVLVPEPSPYGSTPLDGPSKDTQLARSPVRAIETDQSLFPSLLRVAVKVPS